MRTICFIYGLSHQQTPAGPFLLRILLRIRNLFQKRIGAIRFISLDKFFGFIQHFECPTGMLASSQQNKQPKDQIIFHGCKLLTDFITQK